jgi:hypothetical protein
MMLNACPVRPAGSFSDFKFAYAVRVKTAQIQIPRVLLRGCYIVHMIVFLIQLLHYLAAESPRLPPGIANRGMSRFGKEPTVPTGGAPLEIRETN